jgi:hypothetical protein
MPISDNNLLGVRNIEGIAAQAPKTCRQPTAAGTFLSGQPRERPTRRAPEVAHCQLRVYIASLVASSGVGGAKTAVCSLPSRAARSP